jgi:hypothetical protein
MTEKEILENMNIKGELKIVTKSNETGEILDVFEDHNVILTTGKEEILKAMTVLDTNIHRVKTLKIGNDVGATGTVLAPDDATADLTALDLAELYEVPDSAFFITYPSVNSVRFNASLNGVDVMANYPALPNIVYTSAMLETFGGVGVAYRRFPGRTISSLISVDITWTITIL